MTLTAENDPSNLVDSGLWQPSGAKWEFWRSAELPPPELCSAIALVAIMNLERNEVVLTRNQRGWETIAGGVEPGETPAKALRREALEEGGFTVVDEQVYGYRKIVNDAPRPAASGKTYPPLAYMPYYFAETDSPLRRPTGEEILDCGTFCMDDQKTEWMLKPGEVLLIREGLRAARRARGME